MIKEIHEIADKLLSFNLLPSGDIFSKEDIFVLKNAKKALSLIKNDIDNLLQEASPLSLGNREAFIAILTNISHLLCLQSIAANEISTLSVKFIRNYGKKWDSIKNNIA